MKNVGEVEPQDFIQLIKASRSVWVWKGPVKPKLSKEKSKKTKMKSKLLPTADWYKRIAVSILNGEITDKAFNMNDWNKAILCSRRGDSLFPLNICKYNEEQKATEQSQCLCRFYLDLNQNCLCSFDNFFSRKEWSCSSITVHSYWLSCLTLTWSFKCSNEHYPDFNLNKATNTTSPV